MGLSITFFSERLLSILTYKSCTISVVQNSLDVKSNPSSREINLAQRAQKAKTDGLI